MKKSRRKELKTNILSVYLQQIYEAAARNATYLIGGFVVLVLVLVIGLVVQRNRHRALQEAWRQYYELRQQDVRLRPDVLNRTRSLASEYSEDADLGPMALKLQADQCYQLGLSLSESRERSRRLELMKEAKETYERLIRQFASRPDVVAVARMSLAAVEESLVLAGESDITAVRDCYQQLIDGKPNPYQQLARDQLEDLDKRIESLEIVATRPAETTRPAEATRPAETTRPAEGPPPPASAPASTTRPATTTAPAPGASVPAP